MSEGAALDPVVTLAHAVLELLPSLNFRRKPSWIPINSNADSAHASTLSVPLHAPNCSTPSCSRFDRAEWIGAHRVSVCLVGRSIVQDDEIELGQPFRVGEDVKLDDLVVLDRDAENG